MSVQWTSFDVTTAAPGAVHHRDRDRRWWDAGATPKNLIYLPAGVPPDGATVVVAEGEPAADAVSAVQWYAAATVCGAGATPADCVIEFLARYPHLILSPDNDAVGQQHMGRLGREVEARGRTVCHVLRPPTDAPQGWDLADATPVDRVALIAETLARPVVLPECWGDSAVWWPS